MSNLEECKGGLCKAQLRIEYEIQEDGITSIDELRPFERIEFEVKNYEDNQFDIVIRNIY
jgi:hypothetical protein